MSRKFDQSLARLKKNILILGGTGFIGSNLAKYFLKKKYKVICIGTNKSVKKIPKIEYIFSKLSKIKKNHKIFKIKNLYIVNLTGYVDHSEFGSNSNTLADSHLYSVINFCSHINKDNLIRFINIGSADEYGMNKSPLSEDLREQPYTFYAYLKTSLTHFFEMLYKSILFPGVTIRLFLIYGPGQQNNRLIPYVITKLLKNQTAFIGGNGLQNKDFLYIDDLSKIIDKILQTSKYDGKVINVGSGVTSSIKEIIYIIKNEINLGEVIYTKNYRKNENFIQYPSLKIFKSNIKIKKTTSLEFGLKKTIKFYKDHIID